MFKRQSDYEVATKSCLRKKDVKAFCSKLATTLRGYNNDIESDIFGHGKTNTEIIKLRNKCILYLLDDGLPYFIEYPDGRIIPTIYTCWKRSDIIPCIVIYPDVSKRLIEGADLMAPGIINSFSIGDQYKPFLMKSPCCIRILGNPLPFAVGTCIVNNYDECLAKGAGKVISIQQIYGDYLWKAFKSIHPNNGFQLTRIIPIDNEVSQDIDEDDDDEKQTMNEFNNDSILIESKEPTVLEETQEINTIHQSENDESDIKIIIENSSSEQSNSQTLLPSTISISETINENEQNNDLGEDDYSSINDTDSEYNSNSEQETIPVEQEEENTPEIVDKQRLIEYYDEQLLNEFIAGICSMINDDLPMQTSTFYSKYIHVNIKNTSYKKQNRFFTHMYKADYIKIKEGSQQIITFINTQHEAYLKYMSLHPEGTQIKPSTSSRESTCSKDSDSSNAIEIITRYKIPKSLYAIFTEMDQQCDSLFTLSEARAVLTNYFIKHNLIIETNKACITFTTPLYNALYEGKSSFPKGIPTIIERKKLSEQLSLRLLPYHAVKTQNQMFATVKKGVMKPIEIIYGKFKGIKNTITQIYNLSAYEIDIQEFCKEMAKKAASSASIQMTPKNEKFIQVQGNVSKQASDLLNKQFKIPSHLVNIKKK